MYSQDIKKKISQLPDTPGVYLFKRGKTILYIGKATSLKDRVRSYFNADIVETRSPLISKMLTQFTDIDFIKTDSVLEALVLEAHLIKKHQPEANIKEKDNRSFNYVVVTKEDFPRVLVVRGRELEKNDVSTNFSKMSYRVAYTFGPFPNGSQLKEAMKIVRKLFPFRDRCTPYIPDLTNPRAALGLKKPCFNRQIGLCPGVCTGEISKTEYAKQIKNIVLFFESDKKKLIKNLEKQMKDFAKTKQFEKAEQIKKTLFTLQHIQDIGLIKEELVTVQHQFRIESYDIAHLSGQNMVGVMTVVENGEAIKSEYRKFKIKDNPGVNDTKALSEILSRRLAHIEWRMPDLVVVDGGTAQKNIMEKILREHGVQIPVMSVVKDEHHKPKAILGDKKYLMYEKDILLSNAEAHRYAIGYHKQLRNKTMRG